MKGKGLSRILQFILSVGILFFINVVGQYVYTEIDLTEEKRFTLAPSSTKMLASIDENVFIRVLLTGDFPAGFERLESATEELLIDFRDINPDINFVFEDVLEGGKDQIKARRDQLAKDGIVPTSLKYFDGKEYVQKAIYPYALISYKGRNMAINLLQEQNLGDDEQEVLNRSVELLEYQFINALQKLSKKVRQNIAFTKGHDELSQDQTFMLERELRKFYNTGRIDLDSLVSIDQELDLLIVAGPKLPFNDQEKFKIDQYIMHGGKVLWLVDKLDAHLDSINKYQFYVPRDYDTNLDDLLFNYGVRINNSLALDLEASSIPQYVGDQGGKPQTMMFKWYYHPLAQHQNQHIIVKNIDRVNMTFPNVIDTIKTKSNVKKTVLLTTSQYSRFQLNPVRLNFEILKYPPQQEQFNKGRLPLAVLLEGTFDSEYKNRVSEDFKEALNQIGQSFKESSAPTKQIVISDPDLIKNIINLRAGSPEPLGYNKWEFKVYDGNKDFILNTIEFLIHEESVLESRSKEIKLRLLDSVKTSEERTKWQFINLGLPLIFLVLFGTLYHFIRKRRYAA